MGKIAVTMKDIREAEQVYQEDKIQRQLERQKEYDALLNEVFSAINKQLQKFLQKVWAEGLEKHQDDDIAYYELPTKAARTFSVVDVVKDLNAAFKEEESGFVALISRNGAISIHIEDNLKIK